jgi:hypothetical protein
VPAVGVLLDDELLADLDPELFERAVPIPQQALLVGRVEPGARDHLRPSQRAHVLLEHRHDAVEHGGGDEPLFDEQ